MSSAAAAKTSRTQSEGAQAQPRTARWPGTETTRGWSPPSAPPRLQMGRPDDASEAEADSLARRVLSGQPGSASPILAARPPAQPEIHARAGPGQSIAAPAGLENRISSAASEGRPMPQDQRGFFEPRFGHDFSVVRIHDGPASAAAARSAGAQAFTFGRDIYFGAGHYQPHIAQGRDLMAHELAHTVQARSHVIARRALPGPDVAGADQTPEAGPERPGAKPAAGDLHEAMQAGEASTSDRLAGLDPEAKAEALGRLRARLPAGETDKAVKLDRPLAENGKGTLPPQPDRKAGTAGVTQGERERGVEVRALPSAPAPVQQKSAVAPAPCPCLCPCQTLCKCCQAWKAWQL